MKRVLPYALLVIAALAIHARVLGGDTWDDVRYHIQVAPPRLAAAAQVHAGELPRWWDGASWGVPLLAEPSHGAATPVAWIGATPRGADLVIVLCVAWLALGVALWSRRAGASLPAACCAGFLCATTGVVTSAGLAGALPGVMWLPWVGWAALGVAHAATPFARAAWLKTLGWCIGLAALAGDFSAAIDAVAIALALGGLRANRRWLVPAVVLGLGISALQWLPAWSLHGAGATIHGIGPARLVELVVPGAFGAVDPALGVPAIAGGAAWPSLFVGAALVAFAFGASADARPHVRWLVIGTGAAALIVGRGGWPAGLGSPEVHAAAFAILLAVRAGRGIDAFVAGEVRARRVFAIVTGVAIVATWCIVALRDPQAPAVDRALVDGGIGCACLLAAWALVASPKARTLRLGWFALAAALVPNVVALRSTARVVAGAAVDREPRWVTDGLAWLPYPPRRVYRPAVMVGKDQKSVPELVETLRDALDTIDGASGARWGLAAARSDDPARPAADAAAWSASAHGGGQLLERFGVSIAILPTGVVEAGNLHELDRRGAWAIAGYPAAPAAATVSDWQWVADPAAAFAVLFPPDGSRGVPLDTGVLVGAGPAPDTGGVHHASTCKIAQWTPGAIDLACDSPSHAYAVVTSSAADGWTAAVDGAPAPWVVADGLRRAVYVTAGPHEIAWRYRAPGLAAGFGVTATSAALLGLLALARWRKRT